MPEITFIPYVEGEPYDAASLNDRYLSIEAGLEQIPVMNIGAAGIGQDQAPSLAGYTESNTSPHSPHLISIEGLASDSGPPAPNDGADTGNSAREHTFSTHYSNLAQNPAEWPVGVDSGGGGLDVDIGKWLTVRVGKSNSGVEGKLEIFFHTHGGVLSPQEVTYAYPLHLKRDNAVALDEPFAQGLVVMTNVHLRDIEHSPEEGETYCRKYACFSIQLLTYEMGYVPDQPDTHRALWIIIPRTIRYVSEKTIPPDGFFQEDKGDPIWLGPGDATTADKDPETNYAAGDAVSDSWIDVPIRTVIRREDIIAAGYPDDEDLPPILGVRLAVGIWVVKMGPIQDGSYGQDGPSAAPTPGVELYNGSPVTSHGEVRVNIRQGNMSLFPIHASRDKTVFFP